MAIKLRAGDVVHVRATVYQDAETESDLIAVAFKGGGTLWIRRDNIFHIETERQVNEPAWRPSMPEPVWPPLPPMSKIVRMAVDAKPYGDKGLVRYPVPDSPDWFISFPEELFEELGESSDGRIVVRRFIRVSNGKEIKLWECSYAVGINDPERA